MTFACRLAAIGLLPLLLAACAGPGASVADATSLRPIRYHNVWLGTGDFMVEINPAGDVRITERRGAGAQDVRVTLAHLTPRQSAALVNAFQGWKKLDASYPGEWSMLVEITFDGYTVDAHDVNQAPASFRAVKGLLDDIANQAVVAAQASRPAPGAASQP